MADASAEQLIHGQAQGLAGEVPQRGFDRRERGDVLAGLRAGKDARRADPLERRLDVQRVLSHEEAAEHRDERHAALDGIGSFSVAVGP